MFGNNAVTKSFADQIGRDLLVNELFYTIQGEGPDAGRPAIFLRLSKCNLRCYFCDTEFESGQWRNAIELGDTIGQMSALNGCPLVVITGGEPLLQNVVPLITDLNGRGISVSIETAGTVYSAELSRVFSPLRTIADNLIVCSPKTPRVNPELEALVGAWKYIIKAGEVGCAGLPIKSTQIPGQTVPIFVPRDRTVPVYVQAMDEGDEVKNRANMLEAVGVSMRFGYRMSVQMHKIAGLP